MARWPWQRQAAVQAQATSGAAPVKGKRTVDPRQSRARVYARDVGFVGTSYRFQAHQAGRCPVRPESTENGVDWAPSSLNAEVGEDQTELDDVAAWAIAQMIQPERGGQPDLIRQCVYLDETIGEFWLVAQAIDGVGIRYSARDPLAVTPPKNSGDRLWVIQTQPGGKVSKGTAFVARDDQVWRHWQPDSAWEDAATSSLIRLVPDLDTYWSLLRHLRKETNSRLLMNKMFWTPGEAHDEQVTVNGISISALDKLYAESTAKRAQDNDDTDVASVAPFAFHTPALRGQVGIPKPEILDFAPLGQDLLAYLKDWRELIAAGLPLSTQSILDGKEQQPNHWNKWAGDDADVQVVEESLRRTLDALTSALFRPMLNEAKRAGLFRGDPAAWRLGADTDQIRARVDNSANAQFAMTNRYIKVQSGLEALHFDASDIAEADDLALYTMMAKAMATTGAPAPPGQVPGTPGLDAAGGPPNDGEAPALTAALRLVDDRWLLNP